MQTMFASSIVEQFETCGLTPEQIAESMSIDKMLVLSTLLQFSAKFRAVSKTEEEEDKPLVSKSEMRELVGAYKMIAKYGENEGVREKALRNLINVGLKVTDGLGATDVRKLLKDSAGNHNVLNLQMIIQQAREAKKAVQDKVVDILTIEEKTA